MSIMQNMILVTMFVVVRNDLPNDMNIDISFLERGEHGVADPIVGFLPKHHVERRFRKFFLKSLSGLVHHFDKELNLPGRNSM